jgi:hypothetical protein
MTGENVKPNAQDLYKNVQPDKNLEKWRNDAEKVLLHFQAPERVDESTLRKFAFLKLVIIDLLNPMPTARIDSEFQKHFALATGNPSPVAMCVYSH